MRRRWAVGCFALLGIGATLCIVSARDPEPVYAGKTVSQWLDAGYEDAAMALQQIGPPAVPFVMAKLAREDPRYGSLRKYRALRAKIPLPLKTCFPKPRAGNFDELRACSALMEIGPPIVPMLTGFLKDKNPIVREVSAHALGLFRERGRDITQAVPMLAEVLSDSNPDVRARAAWALDSKRIAAK